MPIIGFLCLLIIAIIYGTLKLPTQDELILILASSMFLIIAWVYRREKHTPKGDKEEVKEEK